MEVVGVVVAVADEAVPALLTLVVAVINQGVGVVQIALQHGNPLRIGITRPGLPDEGWRIAEIGSQCFFRSGIIGISAGDFDVRSPCSCERRGVVHVDGYAAMVHERGHGVLLGGGSRVGVGVAVEHVRPVVGGGPEVGGQSAVIVRSVVAEIGVASRARGGPVVVFHKLRHGRGHAAHDGLFGAGAGTEVVEGSILIPRGGDERADGREGLWLRQVAGAKSAPFFGNLSCCHRPVLYRRADGAVIVTQPRTDVGGQLAADAVGRAGIAEDRGGAIVARNHHETGTVHIVEDVEMLHPDALGQLLKDRQGLSGKIQPPERLREASGFRRIDRRGPRQIGDDENRN